MALSPGLCRRSSGAPGGRRAAPCSPRGVGCLRATGEQEEEEEEEEKEETHKEGNAIYKHNYSNGRTPHDKPVKLLTTQE